MGEVNEDELQEYEDIVFGAEDLISEEYLGPDPIYFEDLPNNQMRDEAGHRVPGCYRVPPHLTWV